MSRHERTFRHSGILAMLAVFVFTGVFGLGLLATPVPVHAQLGVPQPVILDPATQAQLAAIATAETSTAVSAGTTATIKVKEDTWQIVKVALTNASILAVLNAANYFAQKVAYDAANYIASGGKGQKPFFTTEGLGDYLGDVAQGAIGEAIGTLSQEGGFEKLGINLCSPSSPRIALNIQLGALRGFAATTRTSPTPRCDWRTISDNWAEFSNLDSDTVLSQVGVMFTPGQNELSAAIEVNRYALQLVDEKQQAALNDYIAKSGFRDLVSKVSGKVLTPAETIKAEMDRANKEAGEGTKRTTEIYSAAAIGQGAFGILPAALQTFAGTLGEKLMKRIFERGLIALTSTGSGPGAEDQTSFGSGLSGGGRAGAELANASLLTPKIISITNFDELTIFGTCPADAAQPDNCVMDTDFFNGVQRSKQDLPLTVSQALRQGFLHGERRLLPISHQNNSSKNCYQSSYCYSNLIKLRRARIIPIGWELAANSPFNDVSDPVTLKEVVDNFNNCPVDSEGDIDLAALPDPLHPWCRLIDPDWIIKYPESICTQQAPGPQLLNPLGSVRGQVCVDSQSCILEDANGKCIGGYGYCLAEKNFWSLGGDVCPAQFATCQTMRKDSDRSQVSYLMNTTEVDICNKENAGCRQYGRTRNLVANGGFEELFGGSARDWAVGEVDATTLFSQNGYNALALASGSSDTQVIPSVLPQEVQELSFSGLAANESSAGAILTVELRFLDSEGNVIFPTAGSLAGDCQQALGGSVAFAEVVTSDSGYLSTKCSVTSPLGTVAAEIVLSSSGGAVFADDVALFGEAYAFSPLDTIHLNAKAESCTAENLGCREFISANGAALNLVRNPGFESQDQGGTLPTVWSVPDPSAYSSNGLFSGEGLAAVILGPAAISQSVDDILPDANYVFSASTRFEGAGTPPSARARLTLRDASGAPLAPVALGDGCVTVGSLIEMALPVGAEYQRATCQFTTPAGARSVLVALSSGASADFVVADQIQLELGVQATAFHEGYTASAKKVHLKAAPAGLNCTGAATDPASCAGFALSCRREEVGCNLYRPVGDGTPVPAITSAGDACPAVCVGYETFKREPTDFNDEAFPLFFIPSTARACSAAEAGCEEFTNLSSAATGGEAREYYSSLRLCTLPDTQTSTYYTWEGSDTSGFQLRVWSLRRSNLNIPATGEFGADPTGGVAPCTNLQYGPTGQPQCADDAVSDNIQSCSKQIALFDPDCREFYDVLGNIHYRYFSKTILSTENCTEYRLTRTDENECRSHGGLWTGAECHYFAVGSQSGACRAEAAGCRAFTGNTSRNIRNVTNDSFESGTTDQWMASPGIGATTTVTNSNDAVSAGGHSLRVTSSQVVKDVSSDLREGKTYILNFWARGGGDLRAMFSASGDADFTFNKVTGTDAPIGLTAEWRPFTVGPVTLTSRPATGADPEDREHLIFTYDAVGAAPAFLDNIVLQEVAEAEYVIQDSWNTPASCDQTPGGEVAPQFMLGCRAYRDVNGVSSNLKSFSRLCREEAVGCSALYDTQNSVSPFGQSYNAVCTIPTACVPSLGVTCDCAVGGVSVCQVTPGASTCQFDSDQDIDERLTTDGGNISPDGDTVRVASDKLVYLIDDPRHRCQERNMGCTELGLPTFNAEGDTVVKWQTSLIFDRPDRYGDQLCRSEENFCQAYTRTVDNAPVYFKDPLNHTCEYRDATFVRGFTFSGWFRKGSNVPCYDDFLQGGTEFGIWKNSDTDYDGWVGTCPANFDQCKEFFDPQDTSQAHPKGQPYYAILNSELDTATCQNQASLTTAPRAASGASACVLFDQTDVLLKRFDTETTYALSDEQNGALVAVQASSDNDANIVIRVDRDRRCGEWLDCRSSETILNASTGKLQSVCTSFGICSEFASQGDSTQCIHYVESLHSGEVLTTDLYQTRPIGRNGFDLAGYSIPGKYPVNELVTLDISRDSDSPDFRLVHSIGQAGCVAYGAPCGDENAFGNRGVCLGPAATRTCVYAIDGNAGYTGEGNFGLSVWETRYPSASCRAFPQEDAPFPSKVADPTGWNLSASTDNNGNPVLIGPGPAFKGANVCQRRFGPDGKEYETCECSYQLARYGNAVNQKYFSMDDGNLPAGYCTGGQYEGYECDPRVGGARSTDNLSCCSAVSEDLFGGSFGGTDCVDGSQCARLSKVDRVVGYEGQCLERDLRNPVNGVFNEFACSTWRPVGIIGGSLDIYNLNQSAGYFVNPDRRFYCVGEREETIVRFGIPGRDEDGDGHLETYDVNEDGEIDPFDLDIMKFFGPGKVNNPASTARSKGLNCENAGENGPWCVWPGLSTEVWIPIQDISNDSTGSTKPCFNHEHCKNTPIFPSFNRPFGFGEPLETSVNGHCAGFEGEEENPEGLDLPADAEGSGYCAWPDPVYDIKKEALGILGCYEVSDGGSASETWIDYPYTGPEIYRQQLKHIFFQVSDDLYDLSNPDEGELDLDDFIRPAGHPQAGETLNGRLAAVTNPYQEVWQDCNDEGNDNIDNEIPSDADDTNIVDDADIKEKGTLAVLASYFFLEESNGFEVDPSDTSGTIILKAYFDAFGRLTKIRVAASDRSDEGAFGLREMGFVFKKGCEAVARADIEGEFGLTKAFTDRINPYADYSGAFPPVLADNGEIIQSFGTACVAWGAVGNISGVPPSAPWTFVTHHEKAVNQCIGTAFLSAGPLGSPLTSVREELEVSIRNLFRRIDLAWFWNGIVTGLAPRQEPIPPEERYTEEAPGPVDFRMTYDDTGELDGSFVLGVVPTGSGGLVTSSYRFPTIASVSTEGCTAVGKCPVGTLRTMTINGRESGIITVQNGILKAVSKFYGWAAHDAMPILSRQVVWGDFTASETAGIGWYKNQKPHCSPSSGPRDGVGECFGIIGLTCASDEDCPGSTCNTESGNHFGNTPGACTEAPFEFQHVYTCTSADLDRMDTCVNDAAGFAANAPCARLVDPDGAGPAATARACVYRPGAQIIDNWDWCNCTGSGCEVSGGAYKNDCDPASATPTRKPWTEFRGELRVFPDPDDPGGPRHGGFIPFEGPDTFTL